MYLARTRSLFLMVFIACALIIGTVIYLQRVFGLVPCVLCLWQRGTLALCAVVSAFASLQGPGAAGYRRYGVLMLLVSITGATMAGAQVWLQTATDDELVPVIAAIEHGLDFVFPGNITDRLRIDAILCAEINWSLFGISLPEWSLLAFVGLALLAIYPLFRAPVRLSGAESRVGD